MNPEPSALTKLLSGGGPGPATTGDLDAAVVRRTPAIAIRTISKPVRAENFAPVRLGYARILNYPSFFRPHLIVTEGSMTSSRAPARNEKEPRRPFVKTMVP